MAIHTAKESLTREEIIDILRRNVKLYKNEPEFVNYIVDLSLYLVGQLDKSQSRMEDPPELDEPRIMIDASVQIERAGLPRSDETPLAPPPGYAKEETPPRAEPPSPKPRIDKGSARVYKAVRASTNTVESLHCPICGSETRGNRICPNCGNVI